MLCPWFIHEKINQSAGKCDHRSSPHSGRVSTGFSIMFLVVAAEVVRGGRQNNDAWKYCGTLMGMVQGFLALCLGRIGSMGLLAPIGYIVPGVAIDLIYGLSSRFDFDRTERMVFANALAAVMASVTANVIVFRLWGPVLLLYLCVSAVSGTIYGFLGAAIAGKLQRAGMGRYAGIQNG